MSVTEHDYDIWDHRFSSLVKEQMEGGLGSPLDYNEANGEPSSWIESPPPGIAPKPTITPDASKSPFYPLQIDTSEEFGEEYSQQIQKLLRENNVDGTYIGYSVSAKNRLIDLITTRAILTITFNLYPRAIKTVYR